MEASLRPGLSGTGLPYVRCAQSHLDFTSASELTLRLDFSPAVWQSNMYLVIDIYSATNPVHPAGHVGWWKWSLDEKGPLDVIVTRSAEGFAVRFGETVASEKWTNADYLGLDEPTLVLHVVLRYAESNSIRFEDSIHVDQTQEALERRDQKRTLLESTWPEPPSVPWYVWPRGTVVHQVATNLFDRDAVGQFAFDTARLLRSAGVECRLYATNFDPDVRGSIQHTSQLLHAVGEDDLVLVHFSIVDAWLPAIAALPATKVLYFHNITPPRFFQVYDAEFAAHCLRGVEQLDLVRTFDVLLANSETSARVLRHAKTAKTSPADASTNGHAAADAAPKGPFEDVSRLLEQASQLLEREPEPEVHVGVCPPYIETPRPEAVRPVQLPRERQRLLYVGRIAPHKRIEDLLALFAQYHAIEPNSTLMLVGSGSFSGYTGYLEHLINTVYARIKKKIHFYQAVDSATLAGFYQAASVVVTMTEHEGFCLPLVEAMAADKPVYAFADDAVRETLGRAGRVFYHKDFAAIARDLHEVLTTPWRQERITAAQRLRLAEIREQARGSEIWAALEQGLRRARAV